MLGEIILTRKSKGTDVRVIDSKTSKREVSIKATGKLKNNVDVNIIVTYWNNRISDDMLYGEGQGVIIIHDEYNNNKSNETATFKEYGIGKIIASNKISWRGFIFFQTNSNEKLSFLNNTIGLFETEEDDNTGIVIEKVWEWR
ncbi:MAG: hypothetical protein ACM3VV_01275 [Deltaproteobacteria bacterium]